MGDSGVAPRVGFAGALGRGFRGRRGVFWRGLISRGGRRTDTSALSHPVRSVVGGQMMRPDDAAR
jgi:hypothetical protein